MSSRSEPIIIKKGLSSGKTYWINQREELIYLIELQIAILSIQSIDQPEKLYNLISMINLLNFVALKM